MVQARVTLLERTVDEQTAKNKALREEVRYNGLLLFLKVLQRLRYSRLSLLRPMVLLYLHLLEEMQTRRWIQLERELEISKHGSKPTSRGTISRQQKRFIKKPGCWRIRSLPCE